MHLARKGKRNTRDTDPAPSVGISAKFLKHDAKAYKVISVPKSAVPPPLLKVVIIAGVPQLDNVTIAIEARRRLERVHHIYSSRGSPTATTQLAAQGIKEPTSRGRTEPPLDDMRSLGPRQRLM